MTTTVSDLPSSGDDLATEILRRRRKRLPALTATLALALAVGAGLIGGIEVQKHWGSTSSSSSGSNAAAIRSAFASRFGSGAGRGGGFADRSGGFGTFGGLGGSATSGTVTLIKGDTLYVTEASGNTVLVKTSPSSRVTKTVTGTVQTIHPGDAVSVAGTAASNGTVTASSIAITAGTGANGQ